METQTNITSTIMNTINSIFDSLFNSINTNLYSTLDDITFVNSNILYDSNFENIFGTSTTNGILLIANSLLIGFLIYFGAKKLFSYLTYSQIESSSSFIFKLITFAIFMNFSFFITEVALDINSNISLAIRALGEDLFKTEISFSNLIKEVNNNIIVTDESLLDSSLLDFSTDSITTSSTIDVFSLDGLIEGAITFSMLNLVLSYSLRYIMIKVFVVLSPFAFLSLCLDSTSWFFKAWSKNLFSLLFIQILVSIILIILFSMDYSDSDLFVKFIYIGGIYALIKANSVVRDFIGGISTTVSQNFNSLSNFNS